MDRPTPIPAGQPTDPQPPPLPARPAETPGPADAPSAELAEEMRVRDRIVVLGRRAAGKTVYLSALYARLYRSLDGMTMRALSGPAHRDVMRVAANLGQGEWPAATFENTLMDVRISYARRDWHLTSMDYSGEFFRKAFIDEDHAAKPVRELLGHLDRAAAVMLLLDPAMVYAHKGDIDAAIDDDFGMLQAASRVRNAPDGEDVPIAVVLTKMDENAPLVKREGGAKDFVRNHWPALLAELKRIHIFQVSAVQTRRDAEGRLVPDPNSTPVNIEAPLKFCLEDMDRNEQRHIAEQVRTTTAETRRLRERIARREEDRRRAFWAIVIVAILLAGAFLVGLIVVYG